MRNQERRKHVCGGSGRRKVKDYEKGRPCGPTQNKETSSLSTSYTPGVVVGYGLSQKLYKYLLLALPGREVTSCPVPVREQ